MSEKWEEAQRRIARALLTGRPARIAGPVVGTGPIRVRLGAGGRTHQILAEEMDVSESPDPDRRWFWRTARAHSASIDRCRTPEEAMAAGDRAYVAHGGLLLNPEDIPAHLREGGK